MKARIIEPSRMSSFAKGSKFRCRNDYADPFNDIPDLDKRQRASVLMSNTYLNEYLWMWNFTDCDNVKVTRDGI